MKRKTYDTRVKYLVRKNLLPQEYKAQINRSLLSKWKREPDKKYVGYELNENLEDLYEIMKLISENQRIRMALRTFYRINKTLKDVIGIGGKYVGKIKQYKEQVIQTIKRSSPSIGLSRSIRLMGISISTYRTWAMEEFFKCGHSISGLCNNQYPQQLTVKEIRKMYRLLSNVKILHWPIISIAHYGRRQNIINVHPNTWYKYARIMKKKRHRYKKVARRYDVGVRAKEPNEKWHADITELRLGNGLLYYIYLVMDNFSKYILSWRISQKKCGKIRLDTFEEAIEEARRMGRRNKPLELIVDGGSENNNKGVEAFVNRQKPLLTKIVALQEIEYSNSMVEALNRTVKYDYLFPKNIFNAAQLHKHMKWMVHDYNFKRPNGTINGQTPAEAQRGKSFNSKLVSNLMKKARTERIKFNQEHCCLGCPFGCS